MIIYVLSLSDMRGQVDRQRIVAWSLDPKKLQDWMESFLVETNPPRTSSVTSTPIKRFSRRAALWSGSTLQWEACKESHDRRFLKRTFRTGKTTSDSSNDFRPRP